MFRTIILHTCHHFARIQRNRRYPENCIACRLVIFELKKKNKWWHMIIATERGTGVKSKHEIGFLPHMWETLIEFYTPNFFSAVFQLAAASCSVAGFWDECVDERYSVFLSLLVSLTVSISVWSQSLPLSPSLPIVLKC